MIQDSIMTKIRLNEQKLLNEFIPKYYKVQRESDALQVAIKYIIIALKKGHLSEELVKELLDLPCITQEILNYIYDNNSTTTEAV